MSMLLALCSVRASITPQVVGRCKREPGEACSSHAVTRDVVCRSCRAWGGRGRAHQCLPPPMSPRRCTLTCLRLAANTHKRHAMTSRRFQRLQQPPSQVPRHSQHFLQPCLSTQGYLAVIELENETGTGKSIMTVPRVWCASHQNFNCSISLQEAGPVSGALHVLVFRCSHAVQRPHTYDRKIV